MGEPEDTDNELDSTLSERDGRANGVNVYSEPRGDSIHPALPLT
jgi:hypothetical protein